VNQVVVIFVPYVEKLADVEARQRERPEPEGDSTAIPKTDSFQPSKGAEQLPLWKWFIFEKGP
jgi:hypothetical protein